MKKYLLVFVLLCIVLFVLQLSNISAQSQASAPEGFVRIEGGNFTMGSPANEPQRDSDETQRQITISGFFMAKHQITQLEYEELMDKNSSHIRGPNLPVENVSWFEALEFCNRRSLREGLTPAYTISGTNVTWNRNAKDR